MNNRNNISKKAFLTLLILIGIGIFYSIYTIRLRNIPSQGQYNQTAIATVFAPTLYPPAVTLNWAYANHSLLRFGLTISGLELVANADDLENIVCNPYVNPSEPISLTLNYREAQIPIQRGNPIELTYEYSMDASKYETLKFDLDLSIGPCGPHFQESNVTPYPMDLIANYHLSFRVPVE